MNNSCIKYSTYFNDSISTTVIPSVLEMSVNFPSQNDNPEMANPTSTGRLTCRLGSPCPSHETIQYSLSKKITRLPEIVIRELPASNRCTSSPSGDKTSILSVQQLRESAFKGI